MPEPKARYQQRQTEPVIQEAAAAVAKEYLGPLASVAVVHSDVL